MGNLVIRKLLNTNSKDSIKSPYLETQMGGMEMIITNFRPIKGSKEYYRVSMRHGISEVYERERHTLRIIFHNAVG
jgi:uncharacterized protein